MPIFLITLFTGFIAWIGKATAVKVGLATLAIAAVSATTIGFGLAIQALLNGITPYLHPYVVDGLSLMPSATETYINICFSATVLRWLYDRQWQAIKIWMGA